MEFYVIVFPSLKKAKAYRLWQGRYIKLTDITSDILEIDLKDCQIALDFGKVWRE